ncbi:MAG TPA: AMP-binding protein [Micromonosporaceae bacterium]
MREPHNLADLVRRAAATRPARAALIWQDRALTWSDLDAKVDAVARGLVRLALGSTDGGAPARVAIALPSVPEFAEAYFGVLRAGLVAVPVNPGYTTRELRHVLRDSGASVLLGTPEVVDALAPVAADLPALAHRYTLGASPSSDARRWSELYASGEDQVDASTGGEDLAVLLYTSGTEGDPKGAMLTHRALIANHVQLAAIEPTPFTGDDVMLLALPLFHAYGLNSGLGAVAYHGATGVLVERFDPADTADLIGRHQVTAVIGVPPMVVAWSLLPDPGDRFGSVRMVVSGAAPLDPDASRRFLDATSHHVFEGYGLTETAPVLTSTLASPVPKAGSIGRPIPDVELRLVNAAGEDIGLDEEDLDDLAQGSPGTDPGEIVVRGPNLFSGYWPDGRGGPDADGWWATGDVAYADADGDLFLVDRIGELILVNGFNVYPNEVEKVLTSHPAVAEAAAVGVPHPYTGQTVKAYVVTVGDVTTEDLLGYCERNLARYKCPTAIEFVPKLPHSPIGKVRKTVLRGGPGDE